MRHALAFDADNDVFWRVVEYIETHTDVRVKHIDDSGAGDPAAAFTVDMDGRRYTIAVLPAEIESQEAA